MLSVFRRLSVLLLALFVVGCGETKPTATSSETSTTTGPSQASDPWKDAAAQLRKIHDSTGLKTVFYRLNSDLGARKDLERPAEPKPESVVALRGLLKLSDRDVTEIKSPSFTPLDAAYLAECLYLRDVARSLDVEGDTPERRAKAAFAWTCRHVVLDPWAWNTGQGLMATALPPSLILPRGFGSGLERAYVFLGLLQQLGIDGCLVGPAEAADKFAGEHATPDIKTGYPAGPFWAVGARIGAGILLFDPWRGEPFPGTLAEVQAKPELLKSWYDDAKAVWPLKPELVKASTIILALPLSSHAPRLSLLEKKLGAEAGAKLAQDAAALRDRFQTETKLTPAFWSVPRDRFDYAHTLAMNLPEELGGWDTTPAGEGQLLNAVRISQLPSFDRIAIPELQGAERKLISQLLDTVRGTYATTFLEQPTPRERLQRGQYDEAARYLVNKQDQFQTGLELASSDRSEVQPWLKKANDLYNAFERARSIDNDPVAQNEAQNLISQHWKFGGNTPKVLVNSLLAPVGMATSTYLLALCKNELAEQSQSRLERATPANRNRLAEQARETWAVARDSWASYDYRSAGVSSSPSQTAHAKKLAARANAMASAQP